MAAYIGPSRRPGGKRDMTRNKKFPPLTAAQQDLVMSAKGWCHHQAFRWAAAIAPSSHQKQYRDQIAEDLYAGAMIGAVEAAARFNPDLGFTFLTYAGDRIFRAMQIAARHLAPIGDSFADHSGRVRESLPGVRVSAMSIDMLDDGQCSSDRMCDLIGSTHDDDVTDRSELWDRLRAVTSNSRDVEIVRMLFEESATYREAATKFGISRERIRQIRNKALEQLRAEEDAIR